MATATTALTPYPTEFPSESFTLVAQALRGSKVGAAKFLHAAYQVLGYTLGQFAPDVDAMQMFSRRDPRTFNAVCPADDDCCKLADSLDDCCKKHSGGMKADATAIDWKAFAKTLFQTLLPVILQVLAGL